MKKFYLLLLLFAGFLCNVAKAQDPNFSQFYYNEAYYNPAFTGINNGLRGVLTNRSFWTNVPGTYRTSHLMVEYHDAYFLNGAFGLNVQSWTKGESFLMSNQVGLQYAKRLYIGSAQFQLGAGGNFVSQSLDFSQLVFPDQLDPRLGQIYQTEFQRPSDKANINFFDFNAGAVCRFNIMQTSTKAIATNNIGIAFHHLTQPNQSYLDKGESKLPLKVNIHWYSFFRISRNAFYNSHFYIAPGAMFETQKMANTMLKANEAGFKTLSFGANAIIPSRLSFMSQLYTGLWMRKQFYKKVALSDVKKDIKSKNFDALVLMLGLIKYSRDGKRSVRFSYSYDLTVSNATFRTGGTHELIISVELHDLALPGGKRKWGYVKHNLTDKFFHMGTGR